ncbi:olfactory receptor 8H1-like, partial [Pelobates cultripes]
SNLHTPMYIFLMMLSLIDISSTSNIMIKMLYMLHTQHKTISFLACITQMYIYSSLTCTDFFLLGAMAYDRYVAICQPLHYFILMSRTHCCLFIITTWILGFLMPLGHIHFISKFYYCTSHIIDHFFCDVTPIMKLSCSDSYVVELLTYIEGTLLLFPDFLLILTSYILIISNIVKIKSTEGQRKAFSTCTSHLTCVAMFYGTVLCLYVRPTSNYSPKQDKFFAILNVIVIPMLNPLIYSLKNQEVKT